MSAPTVTFAATLNALCEVARKSEMLAPQAEASGQALIASLQSGGKVLTCGNGGSAADALHMAEELIGRYRGDRPALPAVCLNGDPTALTCIANDYGFDHIFARQVEALAKAGDIVVGFTTSGNSANVIAALLAARTRGARTIAVTGRTGGRILPHADFALIVPSDDTARIQEMHTLILHYWLERIEATFPPRQLNPLP